MAKNPFKIVRPKLTLPTFAATMKDSLKKPSLGVTQGGSSRKDRGARVAAVVSQVKPKGS